MKAIFPALCWAVIFGGILIACTQKPKPAPLPPIEKVNSQEVKTADAGVEAVPLPDQNETLFDLGFAKAKTWTLYFEFDKYMPKNFEKAAAAAEYLKANPGAQVRIEGHTCPIGTNAYNMALGARRAQSIRAYLDAYGIDDSRMTWQSYGEERLVTKDPKMYSLNRRCEIIVEVSK